MSQHYQLGDPPIPLILRRSARARRISLRISSLDGRVTLTLPKRLAETEALAFARSKEAWIRRHLEARGEDVVVTHGAEIPLGGRMITVVAGAGKRVAGFIERVEPFKLAALFKKRSNFAVHKIE